MAQLATIFTLTNPRLTNLLPILLSRIFVYRGIRSIGSVISQYIADLKEDGN